jgi:hypothetical protein
MEMDMKRLAEVWNAVGSGLQPRRQLPESCARAGFRPAFPDVATMKSILDPSFRYTPSHATDVRKTFERVRREAARVAAIAPRLLLLPVRSATRDGPKEAQ